MGEFSTLIDTIKKDKNQFPLVLDKMKPLINKYTYLLYKDEQEDVRSELVLALWEALSNISYYDNDGQVVNYLSTALKNRFLELYKNSKAYHDHERLLNDDYLLPQNDEGMFEDAIFLADSNSIINKYKGIKKEIIRKILTTNMSDIEIAVDMNISRQYVNRIRRKLKQTIFEDWGYMRDTKK